MTNYAIDYDLAIVGGGIVGTTLAAALKNSGLSIVVIEAQPRDVVIKRKRAYALSLLSGRILDKIGVWQQIWPDIAKFSHIRLSDAEHQGIVKFQTNDLKTEYLGYVGEHEQLLCALQNFISDYQKISYLSEAEVIKVEYDDTGANLAVKIAGQMQNLRCRLVVGSDGPKSPIRQGAGIRTRGWKYWQSCVTFTIKHQATQNDIAFERFWPTGPMGILPLPGNRCQIVWTFPHAQAKAVQELSEPEFIAKLEQHTSGLFGKIELISDRLVFPVQLMQSESYVKHRLALVGDAAHGCHPVGGQGLNLGIRDAAALAQVIQQAHSQGEDIGKLKVLKRYEVWRQIENLTILGFTDFLDRLFSNDWQPLILFRRFGLWLMRHVQPMRIEALKLMTGLKGRAPELKTEN